MEELGQGRDKDTKPVLYFEKGPKGFVLNVTNANTIKKVYGDDTANWIGKPIEIYPAQTEFRGDMVDAIRVRVPDAGPSATTAAVPPAAPPPAPTAAAPPPAPTAAAPMADDNLDAELNDDLKDLPWA
jgi:hypothetical protein